MTTSLPASPTFGEPATGVSSRAPVPSTVVTVGEPTVTLFDGPSICVSDLDGDIEAGSTQGLFVRDTRVISTWRLLLDGAPVEALSVTGAESLEATFEGRGPTRRGDADSQLLVERHRLLSQGLSETVSIHNHGCDVAELDLDLVVDCDFTTMYEIQDGRPVAPHDVQSRADGVTLLFWKEDDRDHGVRISAPDASAARADGTSAMRLQFSVTVAAGHTWRTSVEVTPVTGHDIASSPTSADVHDFGADPHRMRNWRAAMPTIRVDDPSLALAITRSQEDIGALVIVDPQYTHDSIVAAGAPKFMRIFGRDSLITAWMMAPFAPHLALGTLRALAHWQGTRDDARVEEQPGKILHEKRFVLDSSLPVNDQGVYYGSVDSTPLFVMLAGEVARWGASAENLEALMPAVDAAMAWICDHADPDRNGFVEYKRSTGEGLANQGWKDSKDSMVHADGTLATAPVALSEVQGYVYAAFLARASLADKFGDAPGAATWRERAQDLKRRFHEDFWLPDLGFYAMALDGNKRPLAVVSSNIGHCLWTGIVDETVAPLVVERLMSPQMFTGFGIRTLSADARGFNPVSYHLGSVWPHDSVIAASGIAAYGHRDEAARLTDGLMDAARAFGGRLPELFCGFGRTDKAVPIRYPSACSPQAWAAAVPFQSLRVAVNLRPDGEGGVRISAPRGRLTAVEVADLPIGTQRVTVRAGHLPGDMADGE